jgi:hypothetical protein
MIAHALTGLSLALAAPSLAQATPSVAAPAPDAARHAAAAELVDLIFPPATREQMIGTMMRSLLANMQQGMLQNGPFAKMLGDDPRLQKAFADFLAAQQQRSLETMRAGLPGMTAAMTNAYARRFDVGQLNELKAFFRTPTGQAYMQASMTIMSDPDVAAWQRDLMTRSMSHVQADVAAFSKQVEAIVKDKKP